MKVYRKQTLLGLATGNASRDLRIPALRQLLLLGAALPILVLFIL